MNRLRSFTIVFFLITAFGVLAGASDVKKETFGRMPDGRIVSIFTLTDGNLQARITEYGARLVSVRTPDRRGHVADVVLGYDNLQGYIADTASFGAIVGRYAGRIANGTFSLNGHAFQLPKNDGQNTLHGGPENFGKRIWTGKEIADGVELTYVSKDGEAGFPGTLTVTVQYTLSGHDLRIEYHAFTDKDTVLNLTNHAYFNLAGEGSGNILKQEVKIDSDKVVPVDPSLIPTGQVENVAGTPFDFRHLTPIGKNIDASNDQLKYGIGYDISYVLDNHRELAPAAEAYDPASGRMLQVLTDEAGVHFYSGNHLDGPVGKSGHKYAFRNAFCFEAQHYPDSPNHPNFPSTELKPGEAFHAVTIYRFTAK